MTDHVSQVWRIWSSPEFALLVRKYYGADNYGTIFGTLMTSFGIGAFIGPVFEGISVSSSRGYLPGFALAAVVRLAVGLHLLSVAREQLGWEIRSLVDCAKADRVGQA